MPGKASSTDPRSIRRCGEPLGLAGRCGALNRWPAVLTPGKDWALAIGTAKALCVDLDLACPRE